VNFGLFPPLDDRADGRRARGRDRKKGYSRRALADLERWLAALATAA
jgi:methylenetetrahydrofolate--tRNA-(uracil-5-)-methyltransferase